MKAKINIFLFKNQSPCFFSQVCTSAENIIGLLVAIRYNKKDE
jgi:hypothetical protein